MPLPQRKSPGHETPSWIPVGATFFITICCDPRGMNQLCCDSVAPSILDSIRFNHDRQLWFVELALLMPDHMHMLASFPIEASMDKVVMEWKKFVAKTHGIRWQRDFFDHRLRGGENPREKAEYIENNPVRAGLVSRAEDWPHVWRAPVPWSADAER